MALLLSRTAIRLISARDGIKGVEMARTDCPDVILMYINLPGINGFQALALLRADPLTAHIPVVALSANAMPRVIQEGLAAGFFHSLTTPFKVDAVLETLDAAIQFARPDLPQLESDAQAREQ